MKISSITRHRAGTTFVFIFFLIFLGLSLMLIPKILNVYNGITSRAYYMNVQSLALENISGAIKRADSKDSIKLTTLEDSTPALSITNSNICYLYYCKDGYLYKQNAKKTERSAERLCVAGIMRFSINQNSIIVEHILSDNQIKKMIITPRCNILTEEVNEETQQNTPVLT